MTQYVVGCCSGIVATVAVNGGQVSIAPAEGKDVYRVKAPRPVEKGTVVNGYKLTGEQMRFEYRARDKLHELVLAWTEDHSVSEVRWAHHASWVIRCRDCGQQFEVTQSQLPKLAQILGSGDWSAVPDGVVPLRVLNPRL